MKTWQLALIAMMVMASGCGNGDSQEGPADDRLGGVAQPEAEDATSSSDSGAIMQEDVRLDVAPGLNEANRLVVELMTNLPEGTRLQVVFVRDASGVNWRHNATAAQGEIRVGPFGPGSGLPEGQYTLKVEMLPVSVQPAAVRGQLGEQGQHLTGPGVETTDHGLGQVVRRQWPIQIDAEGVQLSS